MKRVLRLTACTVCVLLFASSHLQAAVINVFNTGVDAGGIVVANGTPDIHYTISGPGAIGPDVRAANGAWLAGEAGAFCPLAIPCRKVRAEDDLTEAIRGVRQLREQSKELRGSGYSIAWTEVNSRKFGRNEFPERIVFETEADFLQLIGKQGEFRRFSAAAGKLRAAFPALDPWLVSNPKAFARVASIWWRR